MANLRMYGHIFESLEHAYQCNKAKYLDLEDMATHILNARTVAHAKRIADEELNAGNTNWWRDKTFSMYNLLMAKCEQCPAFKTALLESGEDEIIKDTSQEYRARGLNGQGQNMLAKTSNDCQVWSQR